MSCSAGASSRRDDLRARGAQRELVRGVVLEERQPDDDQEHRHEPDVEDVEEDDGEDDVEQAEQAAGEEHARREACVTAIGSGVSWRPWYRVGSRLRLRGRAPTRLRSALARCCSRSSAPRARRARRRGHDARRRAPSSGKVPTEPTPTVPPEYANGDPAAGKAVFTRSGCGACHTLSDAGATGNVGPNLDEAKPDARARRRPRRERQGRDAAVQGPADRPSRSRTSRRTSSRRRRGG